MIIEDGNRGENVTPLHFLAIRTLLMCQFLAETDRRNIVSQGVGVFA